MLHEFLTDNRSELIERCRGRVAARRAPRATPDELEHGIPLFLDQLSEMLRNEVTTPSHREMVIGCGDSPAEIEIEQGARSHGSELLRSHFPIDQVVHDYGDLCQAITELASEKAAPITVDEFRTLNSRLDCAIATAVTEYSQGRETAIVDEGASAMTERLGVLAHEMRNALNTTILALTAIRMGGVGFGGATAAALDRSLIGMRTLIDRALAGVRLEAGAAKHSEKIEIGPFVSEVRVAAALEASQRGSELTVEPIAVGIFVKADRHILASALSNLLQNAFKFTRPHSHVSLRAWAARGRVFIEVQDQCGGLPAGSSARIFQPFEQAADDRTGVGLGLTLSRRGVEAYGGTLAVRNIPGEGCVFTIELPQTL